MGTRLIVVSNRLPLTLRKADGRWVTERSSGGLASAMNPLLQRSGGDWIGWAGESAEEDQEERRAVLQDWAESRILRRLRQPDSVACVSQLSFSTEVRRERLGGIRRGESHLL